jgi:elongation factor 2
MFGFAGTIRSATQGRALWTTEFAGFEKLPREHMDKITREIRIRKGLKPEPPPLSYYQA